MTSKQTFSDGLDFINEEHSFGHWRICDELNIVQISLLIAGYDPGKDNLEFKIENFKIENQPLSYMSCKISIQNAVIGRRLPAKIKYASTPRNNLFFARKKIEEIFHPITEDNRSLYKQEIDNLFFEVNSVYLSDDESSLDIDFHATKILVDDLKLWLTDRFTEPNFFNTEVTLAASYLDPNHHRYSAKLAASVRAWQAIKEPGGRSPKAALEKWLRENAKENGLTDRNGNLNEQGIQDCAKVANWETKGGAPKTPNTEPPTGSTLAARMKVVGLNKPLAPKT